MLGRHKPRRGVEDEEAARDPESDLRGEEGCGGGKGAGEERWAPGSKGARSSRARSRRGLRLGKFGG